MLGWAFLAQRSESAKKKPMGLYGRHRLEVGIPKEEEEKPRKRIIAETLLRCNSYLEIADLPIRDSYLFDRYGQFANRLIASQQ